MTSRRSVGLKTAWLAALTATALIAAAAAAKTMAASSAAAGSVTQPSPTLAVRDAWSRATAPGAPAGVAYFVIVNTGAADVLMGLESPLAQRVEMHATTTVGGMMEMRSAETVAVPAAGRVAFEPGGLHAMLMDLRRPLTEGERIALTLNFRHAGRVPVQAIVAGPGAMTAPAVPPAARAETAAGVSGTGAAYRLASWPPHAATPDFALVDAEGRSRRLADYRGRTVVLFFGFVRCPDACPAELFKLALVMKRLGSAAARVQVLFVTLDPARDTRRVLKTYVTAFDPRFVGLTGSASQIDRAAANFYVEYARVPTAAEYTIDHSTSTFVLDDGGRLRLVGTAGAGVDDYAHDLELLVEEQQN